MLPNDFPSPPQRPPAEVAMVDRDGRVTTPWANYFTARDRFMAAVRAFLNAL